MPVVGDMCMGSALHMNGEPYEDATTDDGKAIERLTREKFNKYPELVASDRVHFVVLACGEGGRLRIRVSGKDNEKMQRAKICLEMPATKKKAPASLPGFRAPPYKKYRVTRNRVLPDLWGNVCWEQKSV